MKSVDIFEWKKMRGGPGSGNFGHEGRPGEQGGSGSGGSIGVVKTISPSELDLVEPYSRDVVEKYKTDILAGKNITPVFVSPPVEGSDKLNIVDGTHRATAYKELGKSVPIMYVDRINALTTLANMSPEDYFIKNRREIRGGPGSGNFGHAGIPGQIGGSSKGSGGSELKQLSDKQFDKLFFDEHGQADLKTAFKDKGPSDPRAVKALEKLKEDGPSEFWADKFFSPDTKYPSVDPDMKDYVIKNVEDNKINLVESVYNYTDEDFNVINETLRGTYESGVYEEPSQDIIQKIDDVSTFIQDAPKYDGVAYRGIHFTKEEQLNNFVNQFQQGTEFECKSFMSCTKDLEEAKNFRNKGDIGLLFEVKSKNGVYLDGLSAVMSEQEVLFDKSSKFIVSGMLKDEYTGQVNRIILEEL